MRAARFATLALLISMPLVAIAQGRPKTRSTTQNATPAEQAAQLAQQVKQYEGLLQNPDVANSPDLASAIRAKWVTASCNAEVLQLPTSLTGGPDGGHFVDELLSACTKRLQAEKLGGGAAKLGGVEPVAIRNPVEHPSSVVAAPSATEQQVANSALSGDISNDEAPPEHETADVVAGGAPPKQQSQQRAPGSHGQSATAGTQDKTGSKACPNDTYDSTLPVPALDAIEVDTDPITGSVAKSKDGTYPSGKVQLCVDSKTALGDPASVNPKDGTFSVTTKSLPRVSSKQEITAQFINSSNVFSKPGTAVMVGSCKKAAETHPATASAPALESTNATDSTGKATVDYSGTTSAPTSDKVRICVDDIEAKGDLGISTPTSGTGNVFDAGADNVKTKPGDVVTAQVVSGTGTSAKYSKLSNGVPVGPCSASESDKITTTRPTLNPLSTFSDSFSGSMPAAKAGTDVLLCVGDTPNDMPVATAVVKEDGTFTGSIPGGTLRAKETVRVQEVTSEQDQFPRTYSLLSSPRDVSGFAYSTRPYAIFIAGVEQGGFSSQGNSTNAFLEAFFRGPYYRFPAENDRNPWAVALWGRVRLLSGPLPSGTSVTAAFTNPSGTITSSTLANVGQVVDYVFGPELRFYQNDHSNGNTDRFSLIGGVGATTPLNSSGIQNSLTAPAANTQQCFQLLNSSQSPYSFLFTNISTTAGGCTIGDAKTKNAITTLSFAPVDRSNFLVKYGGGIRYTHIYPAKNGQAPYSGSVDFVVGQDQEITGGKFHGVVFGVNGVYPLALGSSSFIYLFGSASMKTTANQNYPPLVLGTAQTPMTPLSTSVEVVPLTQPNRDFYRFGVGVNVMSLICSASKKGCNSGTGSGAANSSGSGTNAGSGADAGSGAGTGTNTGAGNNTSGQNKKGS